MLRAIFELIITIIAVVAARAILGSLMRGFSAASQTGFRPSENAPSQTKEKITIAGELHKDPVCGMYVAESTRFQRKNGREHFYYCSEECKDKHAVAAR